MKSSHISKRMHGLRSRSRQLAHTIVRDTDFIYQLDKLESQLRMLEKSPSRGRE